MSWGTAKFASLVAGTKNAIVGGPFGSKLVSKDYTQDGVPVIRGANMSNGRYISESGLVFVSDEKKRKDLQSNLARPGDMVFTQRGTLGQVAIIPEDGIYKEFVISQSQMRATLDPEKADKHFYYYFFSSKSVVDTILNMTSSSGVPHINLGTLKDFEVPVPPLPIQQRIASILSSYDDMIENNRRRIGLLEQASRLLYREWFVHFRFPGHEMAKIADGLPEGWSIQLLADLCSEGDGIQTGPFGSQLHQSDYTDSGVPVVMPKDIKDNKVDCDGIARIPESLADKLGRHRMLPGDTVYGRRGDIGRRAYVGKRQTGFFCGTGCLRIRPDPEKVNPRYLFETLGSPATSGFIANQAKGSTMPNLSAGALKKVPVLCAPNALQLQFTNIIEPVFEAAEILDEQITRLTRARDLLLPRLMDGRIPV
jgi:type I restriction enzyme, S subunit